MLASQCVVCYANKNVMKTENIKSGQKRTCIRRQMKQVTCARKQRTNSQLYMLKWLVHFTLSLFFKNLSEQQQ